MTMDVVTLGEPLIGLVAAEHRPLAEARDYRAYVVGAESNVAIGLSRLGVGVAYVGRVGDDGFGTMILRRLRAEGVDVAGITVEAGAPTGMLIREVRPLVASNVLYRRAGSAGSRLDPDDLVRSGGLRGARWLHLTGITPALSSTAAAAVEAAMDSARSAGATVSFDINHRRRLWTDEAAAPVLRRLAERADIVLGDAAELALVAGGDPSDQRLIDAGVSLVVTKRSAQGASALDRSGQRIEVPAVTVAGSIDPIGAGDAFCAGFIAARLDSLGVETALRWGNACAAACIAVEGDVEAFPSRAELTGMLAGVPDTVR
jgi:2-dehydro-3-deoxygluconokinase